MTAYNVVRFRVKPGMEDAFVKAQKDALDEGMPGGAVRRGRGHGGRRAKRHREDTGVAAASVAGSAGQGSPRCR